MLLTKKIPVTLIKGDLRGIYCIAFHLSVSTAFFLLWYYFFDRGQEWSFIRWDAFWYSDIVKNGYVYYPDKHSNVAFFPLFPYLWKWLGAGHFWISLLNGSLFISAALILFHTYKLPVKIFLLVLAVPSSFFFFYPYSESLFFFFSSIFLYGFVRKKPGFALTGIFFACLSRSAATVFIPALILTAVFELMNKPGRSTIIYYLSLIMMAVLAMATVTTVQYLQTDTWFAFAKAQIHWNHYLQLPELPFSSWGSKKIVRLDSVAFLAGITSAITVIFAFIKRYNARMVSISPSVFFCLLYIAGITASILLFQGGDLHSLNRYIFATPFFTGFLLAFKNFSLSSVKQGIIVFIMLLAYSALFETFGTFKNFNHTWMVHLFLLSFLFINNKKIGRFAFAVAYTGSILIQIFLFQAFLSGQWVA